MGTLVGKLYPKGRMDIPEASPLILTRGTHRDKILYFMSEGNYISQINSYAYDYHDSTYCQFVPSFANTLSQHRYNRMTIAGTLPTILTLEIKLPEKADRQVGDTYWISLRWGGINQVLIIPTSDSAIVSPYDTYIGPTRIDSSYPYGESYRDVHPRKPGQPGYGEGDNTWHVNPICGCWFCGEYSSPYTIEGGSYGGDYHAFVRERLLLSSSMDGYEPGATPVPPASGLPMIAIQFLGSKRYYPSNGTVRDWEIWPIYTETEWREKQLWGVKYMSIMSSTDWSEGNWTDYFDNPCPGE
jgi:hypothetical protein